MRVKTWIGSACLVHSDVCILFSVFFISWEGDLYLSLWAGERTLPLYGSVLVVRRPKTQRTRLRAAPDTTGSQPPV